MATYGKRFKREDIERFQTVGEWGNEQTVITEKVALANVSHLELSGYS